jgi:malonyl-CoA O-methyltransferase
MGMSMLADEIAARMNGRLDYVKREPRRILDAGSGSAAVVESLRRRYPQSEFIAIDSAIERLHGSRRRRGLAARALAALGLGGSRAMRAVAADLGRLPLADGSVDLVWSNLALHRSHDPLPVLREMHRVLAVEGLLMFSTLGPDTLKELRAAFAEADPGSPHVHGFVDMHDIGDMLVQTGFAAPVMDMETVTITYADVTTLARDLKSSGEANALTARRRGLSGRALWAGLDAAYELWRRDGRLPATFEIVHGHAWKPRPRPALTDVQPVRFHTLARMQPKTGHGSGGG